VTGDPPELGEAFRVLVDALIVAVEELHSLDSTPFPVPDAIETALEERAALAATLKRMRTAFAGRPLEARLVKAYKEERARARSGVADLGFCPVLPEVKVQLDEALEQLRRWRLTIPEVRDALDGPLTYFSDERETGESGA
jgi:hypothetical protein